MPEPWAGTDAGKEEHHCTVIDMDGVKLLSRRVANSEDELLKLLSGVLDLADGGTVTWAADLKRLIQSYLGADRRAGTTGMYSGPKRSYEDDLAESAFSDITKRRSPVRRTWTPTGVVAYLRSTSFARADLFKDRHTRFESEAPALLEQHATDGVLIEDAVFDVLLARRPGGAR
ncbi:hypothetical protein GGE06_002002 [Streptomyces sp. SFB5A]|uniref:Transposase IS110-like N-terminal domain-containing protein n=1 Tax=Streptomyces nymphaeiformis TaxID=2663842 RepID=A0A7W7XA39_9ACTN|nr:hypothetical protein [Streptomyces nymphaeiformis]